MTAEPHALQAPPTPPADRSPTSDAALVFDEVTLAFDDKVVLDRVSFELQAGRMKIVLGASGAGKSTILRLILGLLKPDSGRIFVDGRRVDTMGEAELMDVRANVGMVFQEGALFDSLTVRENVGYRLYEETDTPLVDVDARVAEVLGYVGLGHCADRMPSELSGGERRRVAIARALSSRPRLLLYDEPTTGLDPITALSIDDLFVKLRDLDQVTSIMVTHLLRDAFHIATHEAVATARGTAFRTARADAGARTAFLMLRDGRVAFDGQADDLRRAADTYLKAFLS